MTISFRTARRLPSRIDARVVGVTVEQVERGEGPVDGLAAAFVAGQGFDGAVGQTLVVPDGDGTTRILVGLGPSGDVDVHVLRRAAAAAARAARRRSRIGLDLLGGVPSAVEPAGAIDAIVLGVALASYRFGAYRSDDAANALEEVVVVGSTGARASSAVARARAVADAVCWARDLVNEPGGTMTPVEVAKAARALGRRAGLKVTVMDERAIRSAGLGGLLGVNRGSEQPPRFVRVDYTPSGRTRGSVALVGKGITFDSGGLSIKTAEGMTTMKGDMGGAAAVLGAMSALPALRPGVRVSAYVPLTDNMTGGDATRPGDVLRIKDGTTVEVLNTDAEGRLVLADALAMAVEERPDAVVDVATLTGACMVALGKGIAGLMGRGDAWLEQVEASAARSGERVWRLPLPDDMRGQLDSKVADMKNVASGRHGGALVAGLFLREFVPEDLPWAHIDIAGPAWSDDDHDEVTAGGTGFGVRLLLDLVDNFERP